MVLFTRALPRVARPAASLWTASASRSAPSVTARGAAALRQRYAAPQIRTYADVREKVKVLLVLYDGQYSTAVAN